ncbi:hypothetical protein O9X99_00500 [Agrobacterium salinitolerans]|uniref:hypothetical protein n=1 Tax=Agrobacterium TaxID=357 RepID=UPI0013967FFE|nr:MULTISPECIES: hypothetical protein [Agrobacterium]MCZ7890145.1 hypothetical protein [Agrobacterium salinitolerans]
MLRPGPDSGFYLQTYGLLPVFRSLAIINICRTQSTRAHLRALAHRLRQNRENVGIQRSDVEKGQTVEICVFHIAILFNPPLRRQKTLNAASAGNPGPIVKHGVPIDEAGAFKRTSE